MRLFIRSLYKYSLSRLCSKHSDTENLGSHSWISSRIPVIVSDHRDFHCFVFSFLTTLLRMFWLISHQFVPERQPFFPLSPPVLEHMCLPQSWNKCTLSLKRLDIREISDPDLRGWIPAGQICLAWTADVSAGTLEPKCLGVGQPGSAESRHQRESRKARAQRRMTPWPVAKGTGKGNAEGQVAWPPRACEGPLPALPGDSCLPQVSWDFLTP